MISARLRSSRYFTLLATAALIVAAPSDAAAQAQRVSGSFGQAGDELGHAVAVDADRAVAGAWREDNACPLNPSCDSGGAYVFEYDAVNGWMEVAHLIPSDDSPGDTFGHSVAIDGDHVAIGSPESGLGGAVYVFARDAGGSWVEEQRLTFASAQAGDQYGFSVALEMPYLVVGVRGSDLRDDRAGIAFVYERHASGSWIQVDLLSASDSDVRDYLGVAVGIGGGTIGISAPGDDDAGPDAGSIYLYEPDNVGAWSQSDKVASSGAVPVDECPGSVGVAGDWLVWGKSGVVVSMYRDTGGDWVPGASVEPDGADLSFGCAVAVAGNTLVVGAHQANAILGLGAVNTYSRAGAPSSNPAWNPALSLSPDSLSVGDAFGRSVATDGKWIMVGAPGVDDVAPEAGAVFFFDLMSPLLLAQPLLVAPSDGSTEVSVSPVLVWTGLGNASAYDVQVSESPSMDAPVVDEAGILDTAFVAVGLQPGKLYYWRTRGQNAEASGPWSETFSFTTTSFALGAPSLVSPVDGADGVARSPVLRWVAVSGASSYDVQLSNNASFTAAVLDTTGVDSDSLAVTGLSTLRLHYWRVRARDGGASSAWSTVYSFATGSDTGIDEIGRGIQLGAPYPNPATTEVTIPITSASPNVVSVRVFNVLGQLVRREQVVNLPTGVSRLHFDVSAVSPGLYVAVVESDGATTRQWLTVVR